MTNKEYILVDDSVEGIGGTALTLEGLIEPSKAKVEQVPTRELSLTKVYQCRKKVWIFGNIHGLTVDSYQAIMECMQLCKFFKIDFDYGYCIYRGPIPHQELGGSACDCNSNPKALMHRNIYNLIKERSLHNFYMSREQLDFHSKELNLEASKCSVLSSCFTSSFFNLIEEIKSLHNNGKYAIIDGQGGWHSKAKGVTKAINHAKENNISYDILKTNSHEELMRTLCSYKGLIFLPLIHDTCPRITIEAKLLGLDLIINEKCQHTLEDWWSFPFPKMVEYLSGRPRHLWKSIDEFSYSNSSSR